MTGDAFESALHDPSRGVATDLSPAADALLVAFGGLHGAMGIAPFEFFRLASGIGTKKVFVRDLDRAWYHRGVRGLGSSIDEVANGLAEVLAAAGAHRVVAVGNSAGGYAALLFGRLLGLDEVHAFSPQTFLGPRDRIRHLEYRWRRELRVLRRQVPDRRYLDLRGVLDRPEAAAKPAHVHYCHTSRLDRIHAERVSALPGVVLHPYDVAGHALVNTLRDTGELERILRGALTR